MKTGAIIFRRAVGLWVIDEFGDDGRYLGSHGGNHSFPHISGWKKQIEWPKEIMPLRAMSTTPFLQRDKPQGRVGLMRCIDGDAQPVRKPA